MSILNPGSLHYDPAAGASGFALVDYADYPDASEEVDDLDNDPAAVTVEPE